MAHSPHRRWKGCPICAPHKVRGSRERKVPTAVARALGGRRAFKRPLGQD